MEGGDLFGEGHVDGLRAIRDMETPIDPFINESSAFADYIVPDTVLYETWGATGPWAGYLTKVNSVRWPVVEPPQEKTPDGDPICMESFLIAVARRMGLPGFGDEAIPDADGNMHPLNHLEDWHLRVAANIAFDGDPVPDAPDEELALTGVERIGDKIKAVLKPEERRKVAYVLARGGRSEQGSHLTLRGLQQTTSPAASQLSREFRSADGAPICLNWRP